MSTDKKESELLKSIKEKEVESYSFYKYYDVVYMVLKLMNAYELESYRAVGKGHNGPAIIVANKKTPETKRVVINKSLLDFIDLQNEYAFEDTLSLYSFGPSNSRFKIDLPENQDLDYIQDFADVLFEYRKENSITDFSQKELNEFMDKYLELSQEEIELRKIRIKEKVKKK